MNAKEATEMSKWVKGLFAAVTDEQRDYLAEQLMAFPKNVAEAVIKTHRAQSHGGRDFLDIPQLLTGLRTGADRHAALKTSWSRERVIDFLRRMQSATYAGLDDVGALMAHYGKAWNDVAAQGVAMDDMRRSIMGHATNAFVEIGYSEQEAKELARACVGQQEVAA